jgi:CRISPR/Cas system-associated protein Csm6
MRLRTAATALALAALLAGCGSTSSSSSSDFSGEEKQVADVVEQLQSDGESRDAKGICEDVLASALVKQIQQAGSTCEAEIDKAIRDADDYDLEVQDVTITGDTATAKVKGRVGDADQVREFKFVREKAGWRAADLGSSS